MDTGVTASIENGRMVWLPETVKCVAPGPMTVTASVMFNVLASVIVPSPGRLKQIESAAKLALVSRTAWRSEPGPESLVFVTTALIGILTLKAPSWLNGIALLDVS